ncbi:MAG: pyridoxamine 5'-phosphate oxidase, partial [bacterium]
RREYRRHGLNEKTMPSKPIPFFERWFQEALHAKVLDANAFTVATLTPRGFPATRTVLLKGLDRRGFQFFTNYDSQKGRELTRKPRASLLFYWKELERQIRVDGRVEKVSKPESDAYFKTRPRGSQLGAWASDQSEIVPNRDYLEKRLLSFREKFEGLVVPRPPHWGGFRVLPDLVEYWQGRPDRMHDRVRYRLVSGSTWKRERLSP